MILYSSHLGWLHATIKRNGSQKIPDEIQRARIAQLLDSNSPLTDLPKIDKSVQSIVDIFFDIGLVEKGDYGIKALSWKEIDSYNDLTKSLLTSFESTLIRKMSIQYVINVVEGEDSFKPPPYVSEAVVEFSNRVEVDKNIRNFLSNVKIKNSKTAPKKDIQKPRRRRKRPKGRK